MPLVNYEAVILDLSAQFRYAIDAARGNGKFVSDIAFCSFPCGCCGDTCYLLGQYLLNHSINSTYVCGNYYYDNPEEGGQSQAWILVKGLIVDITGDQFKYHGEFNNYSLSVYVGKGDVFHKLFHVEDRDTHPLFSLSHYSDFRLNTLYRKIECNLL